VEIVHDKNTYALSNPFHGVVVRFPDHSGPTIEKLKSPRTRDELVVSGLLSESVFQGLINEYILIDAENIEVYKNGFLKEPKCKVGHYRKWFESSEVAGREVALFGLPIESGSSCAGTSGGMEIIRQTLSAIVNAWGKYEQSDSVLLDYDSRLQYRLSHLKIVDFGDVAYSGYDSIVDVSLRLKAIIARLVSGSTPFVSLGGDHSGTWFILDALVPHFTKINVIHLDAHHDMYHSVFDVGGTTPVVNHGNVFHHLHKSPRINHILQLGLRTLEVVDPGSHPDKYIKRKYLSSWEIQDAKMVDVFESLDPAIPCYISFDVDVLDPTIFPHTNTPVPGGISFYKARKILNYACSNYKIVGIDFVETSFDKHLPVDAYLLSLARVISSCLISMGCSDSSEQQLMLW
jgi:agmatinase